MFSCWIAHAMMKSAQSKSPVYQTPSPVLVPVLLVDSAEDALDRADRAAQGLSGLVPVLVVDQELPDEAVPFLDLAQNSV
jgi:hypothetical protein